MKVAAQARRARPKPPAVRPPQPSVPPEPGPCPPAPPRAPFPPWGGTSPSGTGGRRWTWPPPAAAWGTVPFRVPLSPNPEGPPERRQERRCPPASRMRRRPLAWWRSRISSGPATRPDVLRHPRPPRRDPRGFLETAAGDAGFWWRMEYPMPSYALNYSDEDFIYDFDGYEVSHSYRAILALYALIFLLGVLGNGAVIWVTGFELRRTVNGVWFLNLSVADLLCCLALPFLALPLVRDHHWPLGRFACKLVPSLTILNMFASVLLLMAISADRCALVTQPVWCQNHRTLGLARGACAAAWFLAGLLTLPSFIFRTTRSDDFSEKTTCVMDYQAVGHHQHLTELIISIIRFLCGFLMPFVVITACYSLLLARIHSKGFARSQKAIKLVLVVIISFFVCWLPYHIVGLIMASTHPHSTLFKGALEADPIVAGIAYINSCINPIIYVVMGQDFKDKFQRSWRAVLRGVLSDDPTSTMGDSRMKTKSTVDDQSVSTTV
ncbi:C5a anaphylatoxin chemotactic receptor 1-like isoform X5 [Larus michahellis]